MTDTERAKISEMLETQRAASSESREEARASLMRSGLYREDGSLKARYGGKKYKAA